MNLTELWRNWEAVGAEIKRQKARGEPPNTKKALDYVKQQNETPWPEDEEAKEV